MKTVMHTVITQPAHDALGKSPEGPLKVLKSRTYRDVQVTLRGAMQKLMI